MARKARNAGELGLPKKGAQGDENIAFIGSLCGIAWIRSFLYI